MMSKMLRASKHRATKRQVQLMGLILAGIGKQWLDMDQLIEKLEVTDSINSKQSLQGSIRVLEHHKLVHRAYENRRGKIRAVIVPTGKGFLEFKK